MSRDNGEVVIITLSYYPIIALIKLPLNRNA